MDGVLEGIRAVLQGEDYSDVKPLPIDRWLAASCLQKAIRRNDVATALRAGLTLWTHDRRSFWRRISIIALEDSGAASPDAIIKTLTAFNNGAWRAKHDDLKIGLYLTKLLCTSTKLRLADEFYSIASVGREYGELRVALAKVPDNALADYALLQLNPLPERCLALWLLAGTKRYPHDNLPMRVGSLEAAFEVVQNLDAPDDLKKCCLGAAFKSQWPLALFTPLLYQEVQRQPRPLFVWYDVFEPSEIYKGVPLVGLDMFTRLGKACTGQLQKSVPELKAFSVKQIGLGVFYSEGYCVNARLTSERLEEYRRAGEIADIEAAGLDVPSYLGLRELLDAHVGTLNTIRRKRLKAYLEAGYE